MCKVPSALERSVQESTGTKLDGFNTTLGVENAVCSNGISANFDTVQRRSLNNGTMQISLGCIHVSLCEDVLDMHGYN